MIEIESIDEHFTRGVRALGRGPAPMRRLPAREAELLPALFEAQAQSRHLDFAARWLQARGRGHYTIGSAGHEGNAALGLLSRVDDPALLHYRSGGFYAARASLAGTTSPVRDVLLSLVSARSDPMSGGRHKVFGHPALNVIPQTSTIASHLPRAVGLAYSLGLAHRLGRDAPWPSDAVVVCSFGDASVNHSTAAGAFNAAAYLNHRGLGCPLLLVCEDNGLGISTESPAGWVQAALSALPGIPYRQVNGEDPLGLLTTTQEVVDSVRSTRRPAVLHLRMVRFLGHAGSDAELGYRSRSEILADFARDPLLATASAIVAAGTWSTEEVLACYETARSEVMAAAHDVLDERHLDSRAVVAAPLMLPPPDPVVVAVDLIAAAAGPALTLAQVVNATLAELLAGHPELLLMGQDVAVKGGVYGVTRGLQRRFGRLRVFDTLLDEQTILGVALGAALAGFMPVPEIQYLAYLHNAEDQLRGEAASLSFFSNGQYRNGMVLRLPGLAYQRGFGGHFHNDNSVAVLRDIPGLVLACPSHPAHAGGLLRTCVDLARDEGRVCVYLEPIARYHTRDLFEDGDALWTAEPDSSPVRLGSVRRHGQGRDVGLVTFGNGVFLSRRAARRLERTGIGVSVLDLQWLAPLPIESLRAAIQDVGAVLVVDETRASGGVSEGIITGLIDTGFTGRLARVASADSYIPLGPAAGTVLVSEGEIVAAATALVDR